MKSGGVLFFFCKQKTAYEMRISDWSSDVCSSDLTYHGWFKVAAISVLTDELIRFSDPSAENYVRDALADVLVARMDTDFIDPAFAGSANVSPASITNGVTPTTSSRTDADAVRADRQSVV